MVTMPMAQCTKQSLLLVDDEEYILGALRRVFRNQPYGVRVAHCANEALFKLERQPADVVISDQRMPGLTGIEFLVQVREKYPDTVRIILTGYADIDVAMAAINEGGVYRFLTKPWRNEHLRLTVKQGLAQRDLVLENNRLRVLLMKQNKELQLANANLQSTVQEQSIRLHTAFVRAITALGEALEAKDDYTRGHSRRVADLAATCARETGMPADFLEKVYLAGLLHDIGKIGVREAVLNKRGALDSNERVHIAVHPAIGERILQPIADDPGLMAMVRHHHERWDGAGYPDGLKGKEVPPGAMILALADAFDALTSNRPYRRAKTIAEACEEIAGLSGSQFDPSLVRTFLEHVAESEATISAEPGPSD